ncbi:putative RNA-binding protein Luc7-like 1 [Brienomyrus brachyistius]|uniref:putative RNA-binding protein Luc7-like 1 n=1 Tax=Brienomyrus brachyistius TaxID=42636 RepID=UPI0020B3BCE2|nr:putative RNA-binding protein Luc7-like 1 [Brienomyrus brachyistius]
MSAQAQMRAMLDQLMGTGRDGDSMRQRIKFTDERVCKSHLLESCPHDILSGTRMDLGECMKVHDLALRADYEIASKQQEYFFELDAAEHLQSFIADCDRRTELAKKRLAETQEEISAEVAAKAERVHELNEEIGKLLARAEQLGGEGNVEEAQQVLEKVEKTRALKREAEDIYRNSMPASSFQQQKLRVCEVCSAYLGLHDNDRRLADHFGGKLHLGFIEIREKLEKLRKTVSEKQMQMRLRRREERDRVEEREREWEREKEKERDRDREKEREREKRRDGRSSSSHHSRRHHSSCSREEGAERERERERRHRHKDKDKDKDRHRSRSHSHSHRSKKKRSSRDRSPHLKESDQSPSLERRKERRGERGAEWLREGQALGTEDSPSTEMPKGRDYGRGRERSLSFERERRSSSEERESGEL